MTTAGDPLRRRSENTAIAPGRRVRRPHDPLTRRL